MDSVQPKPNGDSIDDESAEQSFSLESPESCIVFGDPVLLPRVGDQYQAEIPSPTIESDYLQLTRIPGGSQDFLIGLPIPIMWINVEVENIKRESLESDGDLIDVPAKNEPAQPACIKGNELRPKIESMDIVSDNGIKLEPEVLTLQQEMKIEMYQKHGAKGWSLVPGSLGDSWSDPEEASFLLGLYIFGKDLVKVKRFVKSKKMGDILSHYYGKFYRSDKYCIWSECRKRKRKKSKIGQKIFTGPRQQELLSRLLPVVSEEFHGTLLEISKAFVDGKMSLEEYVFTLKARVGLSNLVEAVGIGKGKQDLTSIALEPLKTNQAAPARLEIPTGKACSELTTTEIINFLTGDFRLSKARSGDLFWEAVWPRLLARGWHSEQPNNYSCAIGTKHSLVFLIPGIKKFSRRKLVKGNHYFDSVSDVLSKVASEPDLLELEIEADEGERKEKECGWSNGTKFDQEDLSDQQPRCCYLKPRTSFLDADVMKFTVVDTSWANGQTFKLRELRSLPVDMMNTSTFGSHSEESDENSSEEPYSADSCYFDGDETNISKSIKISEGEVLETNALNPEFAVNDPESSNEPVKISRNQNTSMCSESNDTETRSTKCQLSWSMKRKPDNKYHLAQVTKKRRKLTRTETSHSTIRSLADPRLKQGDATGCSDLPAFSEMNLSQGNPSQEKLSFTNCSSKGSPAKTTENIINNACFGVQHPYEKPQLRTLIDLNLPIPSDGETEEPIVMESTEIQHTPTSNDLNAQITSKCMPSSEQQPNMNSRRQSTRNRPLTPKALEALAYGFLSTKRRQKSSKEEISILRPPRRSSGRMGVTENFGTDIMDFDLEERGKGVCNSNSDMLSEVQV